MENVHAAQTILKSLKLRVKFKMLVELNNDIQYDYTSSNLILDATHSCMKLRLAELKFDKNWSISMCKIQLEKRFGSNVED